MTATGLAWRGARLTAVVLALGALGCTATSRPSADRAAAGLEIVRSPDEQARRAAADPDQRLVDLAEAVPEARLDLRYATADNFMGEVLYPSAHAYLRAPAARALAAVQADLASRGLGLVVYDAYRPYAVTVRMWERYRDPDYVADPAHGSRHNRGAAVDVGLVGLATGEPLPMPTPYDTFSEEAHHAWQGGPPEALANREVLRRAMEAHGFAPLPTEWWHYDFRGWERFPLLDLGLDEVPVTAPR